MLRFQLDLRRAGVALAAGLALLPAWGQADPDALRRQVEDTERAFARSMAERDHAAFTRHLSEQAVFYGSTPVLRGQAGVGSGLEGFFGEPKGPVSWGAAPVQR